MHDLHRTQDIFSGALQSTPGTLPDIFKNSSGLSLRKRFDVYRNNLRSSLIDALRQTFPIIERLVGLDYFKAIAAIFIDNNLPRQGTLIGYGAGFPEFLESRKELDTFPYLGDVARLELAWLGAYHAADVQPLAGSDLSSLAPQNADNLMLDLSPSVHLLSPKLPIYEIWQKNSKGEDSPIDLDQNEENILIFRPRLDVIVVPISPDSMAFLVACSAKKTLKEAFTASLQRNPAFDLTQTLSGFILQGLFSAFRTSAEFSEENNQ